MICFFLHRFTFAHRAQAYYGGEARCEDRVGGDVYNPEELVCGRCSDVSQAQVGLAELSPCLYSHVFTNSHLSATRMLQMLNVLQSRFPGLVALNGFNSIVCHTRVHLSGTLTMKQSL